MTAALASEASPFTFSSSWLPIRSDDAAGLQVSAAAGQGVEELFARRERLLAGLDAILGQSGLFAELAVPLAEAIDPSECHISRRAYLELAERGEILRAKAIARIDADLWSKAAELSGVVDIMPAARKKQWQSGLEGFDVPEFSRANVGRTIRALLAERQDYFNERVTGLFDSLSPNHKTNDPYGFHRRMILEYCFDAYGNPSSYKADIIQDLRVVIGMFTGNEPKMRTYNLMGELRRNFIGDWVDFDGNAVRIRVYKKGTAHLEIHPDVAYRLNCVLAAARPKALAADALQKPVKLRSTPRLRDQTIPGFIVNALLYARWTGLTATIDRSGDPLEVRSLRSFLAHFGVILKHYTITVPNEGAKALLQRSALTGYVPETTSHQHYPTPLPLAEFMAELADLPNGSRLLEPSAGTGSLAFAATNSASHLDLTCIEISSIFADALRSAGLNCVCGDFLAMPGAAEYDRILMNPPFHGQQWRDHVSHALTHLAPGGILVAVVPAGVSFCCEGADVAEIPHEHKFPHVSISTKILRITKAA